MEGARSESFTQSSQLGNYARFMLPQLFEPWAAELVAPRAYETASYQVSDAELTELLPAAGLRDVSVAASNSARRRQGQPGRSSGRLAARWPCSRPVAWPTSIR
jgi:hypothetical protein